MKDFPDGDSSILGTPSVEHVEDLSQRRVPERYAIAGGDFRAVYERHAAEILRYAIRCTGRREIAEELTSEAFLKMYQHRAQVDFSRAAAWLTMAVKNLAIDYWRRLEVERRAGNAQAAAGPDHALPRGRDWEELIEHRSLKPEHRVCLTLHYVHGMANKEITSHTGLSENQVKSSLQYGLKLLRHAFGSKEGAT